MRIIRLKLLAFSLFAGSLLASGFAQQAPWGARIYRSLPGTAFTQPTRLQTRFQ